MGIKVKGITQAVHNLNSIIDDVQGRKAFRALQSALLLISARAAYYTPIDTSTLINSQFRDVDINGTHITGRVGYSAKYAVYVHSMPGKLKGQPRAHFGKTRAGENFGGGTGKGNYWDPHAEPQFLTRGADEERDAVTAVMRKELSL